MSVFECSELQLRHGLMCEFDVLVLQAPGLLLGRMREFVQQRWGVGARHTSHVTRHTSHVTRHTSCLVTHNLQDARRRVDEGAAQTHRT